MTQKRNLHTSQWIHPPITKKSIFIHILKKILINILAVVSCNSLIFHFFFIQDSNRRESWSIHSMQLCRRKIQSLSNAKQKVNQCRKSNGTRTVNCSRRAHINSYFPMEICFSSVSCTHVATVRKAIPVFIGARQEMRSEWREVEMRRYKLLVSVPFQALNFSLVLFQSQHGIQPLQPHLNLMIEENVLLLTFISYHRMKYGSDLMFSYFSPFLIAAALFCRR